MRLRWTVHIFILLLLVNCSSGGSDGTTETGMNPQSTDDPTNMLPANTTARYKIIFESTWTNLSHPMNFPSNPHFSPLIGTTHNANTRLWELGTLSSDGIELMAEEGNNSILEDEIVNNPETENMIQGSGLSSPGAIAVEFDISAEYPLVSIVSMLAPSPDWFIGIDSLNLIQNGQWLDTMEIDLFVYDAGTDDGTSYDSPNNDSQPKQIITKLTSSQTDFTDGLPHIGTLMILKQ